MKINNWVCSALFMFLLMSCEDNGMVDGNITIQDQEYDSSGLKKIIPGIAIIEPEYQEPEYPELEYQKPEYPELEYQGVEYLEYLIRNIALNKLAIQSSTVGFAEASRAVDGNIDGRLFKGSVSLTTVEYLPWFEIDLQGYYDIEKVLIFNSTEHPLDENLNFSTIQLRRDYVDQGYEKINKDSTNKKKRVYIIDFANNVTNQVRIQLHKTGFLALAEVVVIARKKIEANVNEGMEYVCKDKPFGFSTNFKGFEPNQLEYIRLKEGWEMYFCNALDYSNCIYFKPGNREQYILSSELNQKNYLSGYTFAYVQPSNFQVAIRAFFNDDKPDRKIGMTYIKSQRWVSTQTKPAETRRILFYNSDDKESHMRRVKMPLLFYGLQNACHLQNPIEGILIKIEDQRGDIRIDGDLVIDTINDKGPDGPRIVVTWKDFTFAKIPSFAMFISNDSAMNKEEYAEQLCGYVDTVMTDSLANVNCFKPGKFTYDMVSNTGGLVFKEYGDMHDLLWIQGHGYRVASGVYPISKKEEEVKFNDLANEIGKLNTKWFVTGACSSMGGKKGDGIPTVVRNSFEKMLKRLHGVGGMRGTASWSKNEEFFKKKHFGDELKANKEVGAAFVYAMWRKKDRDGDFRDPRFITLEEKDCTVSAQNTYMRSSRFFNDYKDKKIDANGDLDPKYKYYCMRQFKSWDYVLEGDILPPAVPIGNSSIVKNNILTNEFSSVFTATFPTDDMILNNSNLKINGEVLKTIKTDDSTVYEFENHTIVKRHNTTSILSKRDIVPLSEVFGKDEKNFSYIFEHKAEAVARSMTRMDIVLVNIGNDTLNSFEKDSGSLDDSNESIQKVIFIYSPIVNGKIIDNANIDVHFDGKGLSDVYSNTPLEVEFFDNTSINEDYQIADEILSKTGDFVKEINTDNLQYILDENGLVKPVYYHESPEDQLLEISLYKNK